MQPRLKRLADLEGPDFYPTPPWATYALIENEFFEGDIHDTLYQIFIIIRPILPFIAGLILLECSLSRLII